MHIHGPPRGPYEGHLTIISIADASKLPYFLALSYEWTPPSMDGVKGTTMTLGGHQMAIKANLAAFLTHWLARFMPLEAYWWIDAIYINQNNTEKRQSQVRIMSRIFESARLTYI